MRKAQDAMKSTEPTDHLFKTRQPYTTLIQDTCTCARFVQSIGRVAKGHVLVELHGHRHADIIIMG